jgi:hypothetical protein
VRGSYAFKVRDAHTFHSLKTKGTWSSILQDDSQIESQWESNKDGEAIIHTKIGPL